MVTMVLGVVLTVVSHGVCIFPTGTSGEVCFPLHTTATGFRTVSHLEKTNIVFYRKTFEALSPPLTPRFTICTSVGVTGVGRDPQSALAVSIECRFFLG